MKRAAVLLLLAVTACGGGGSADDDSIDAAVAPDAPRGPCDPVAQTGCGDGEKCTDVEIGFDLTTVECVPAGPQQADESCSWGPSGAYPRYDDCAAGSICYGGECHPMCEYQSDTGCPHAGDACDPFPSINGENFGTCWHVCDPVTQVRAYDEAAACGSPDPASPDHGCYFRYQDHTGLCVLTPPQAVDLRQDDPSFEGYLSGCAPGYGPLSTGGTSAICTAFCRPTETSLESPAGSEGEPSSGYTCSDRGAASHECRFYWFFEGTFADSADNGIGLCWDPGSFVDDWDHDASTPDTGAPACTTLTTADTDLDGTPDNKQYGCAPL